MTSGGTQPILGVGVGGGFSPGAEVLVKEKPGSQNWVVEGPFAYGGKTQVFEVCQGEETDFASVPRVLVWFLPRYGLYTLPAILHDHLWRVEAPKGHISYRDADATLRRAMRERGVPFATRWIMWAAVRWASIFTRKGGRKGCLPDVPAMLLVTIPTLAVLLPAILLVAVTLLVATVLEFIIFVVLLATKKVRELVGKPATKKVNPPKISWKL
ncbi:MAG TPA: DUF1353 domain-containing protein [Frankiaceae bacterium]|jgi:hypothetical protein|nr:DUF1353 domain-containing protein [Frankiaceae bacterium]